MTRTALAIAVLAFSFIGIADSAYLAESAYTDTPLTCNIAGLTGCNIVAQSPYSHLFGVPLGAYGVVFYGLTFALAALALYISGRRIYKTLYIVSIIGLVASAIFVGIQVFLIQAVCLYCLGSALLSVLVFWGSRALFRKPAAAGTAPVVTPWQSGS